MQNFQDTFEIRKRLLSMPFSICMTVPLNNEFNSWMILSNYKKKTRRRGCFL